MATVTTEFATETANARTDFEWERGQGLPAWLLSVVLHATIFMAFGLLAPVTPSHPPGDPERVVGIALVRRTSTNESQYFTEANAGSSAATSANSEASRSASPTVPGVSSLQSFSASSGIQLPVPGSGAAAAGGNSIGIPNAAGLTTGGAGRGSPSVGGQTRTQVFGAQGEGSEFVYVFDRSSSMGGFNGRPLFAAKSQLQNSLNDLVSGNQFQIVFYNEKPTIFNPFRPNPPKMFFATDENKQLAREYVRSITAAGGTGHVEALEFALRMGPDVIFFLTDAGEPGLSARQLGDLHRKNRAAAVIHTIEFGSGPFSGGDNFLVQLARQNAGQHVYVDVTRLPNGT